MSIPNHISIQFIALYKPELTTSEAMKWLRGLVGEARLRSDEFAERLDRKRYGKGARNLKFNTLKVLQLKIELENSKNES